MMNFFGSKKEIEFMTSETDPVNVFPDEIRELIWSHLPVNDLVRATLVSKFWNLTIGSSLTFRKNVVIRLHCWNKEPPVEIANSSRNYEIVSFSDFKISSTTLHRLRDKKWSNVSLNVGKISSQKSFVKMMETFSTVRNLKIMCINIRELSGSPRIILPELECLVLSDVTLDLFDLFIAFQPSLKSISLRFLSCDILSPLRVGEAIVEFLKHNAQLKHLEINYLVANDLFSDDISSSLNLQLRSLTIGLDDTAISTQNNIEEFLKSQGEHIEELKFVFHQKTIKRGPHEWGFYDHENESIELSSNELLIIFKVWNSLTMLTSLNIRFLKNSAEMNDTRELLKSLKRNTNVTSFKVQHMDCTAPASIIIDFMKLMPNLKCLYATKLSPAIVRYAAINLKALRRLSCYSFEGECEQEFNELKTTRNDVNKFIVLCDRCANG